MKKPALLTALLALSLLLSACASGASASGFRSGTGGARSLTPEAKLALGTLKLENTKEAVDAGMAAKLLPLWQLLNQLNTSTTAAPQEVSAVVDQIQGTMTPAQVSAISRMQITGADMFAVLQQQASGSGSSFAAGTRAATGSTRTNRGNGGGQGFFFIGDGATGGGFPGGGGGFGNGGTGRGAATGTGTSTPQGSGSAQRSQSISNAGTTILINQVIRLLEGKIKS